MTAIVGMMEAEGLRSRCVQVEVRNVAAAHVLLSRVPHVWLKAMATGCCVLSFTAVLIFAK